MYNTSSPQNYTVEMRLAPEDHLQTTYKYNLFYLKVLFSFEGSINCCSLPLPLTLWHKSILTRSGMRKPVKQTLHNLHFRVATRRGKCLASHSNFHGSGVPDMLRSVYGWLISHIPFCGLRHSVCNVLSYYALEWSQVWMISHDLQKVNLLLFI